MQAIHITCQYDRLLALTDSLEARVASLEGVLLLDYGFSQKRIDGYVVLRWAEEEVDQAFLRQLETEERRPFSIFVFTPLFAPRTSTQGRIRSFESNPDF